MNIEALVLFIYETSLLIDIEYIDYNNRDYIIKYPFGTSIIDEAFISQLNDFIEKTFNENKEVLNVIFNNLELLKDFIDNGYAVLEYKTIFKILENYQGIDGYLNLLNNIDKETDKKLNKLSLSFIKYYNSILDLYNEEYTDYKKILQ